jgi:two-component system phosphate regulon sensor histidine kinase PhoR
MHLGFRGKLFLATFGVAAAALLLVATLASLWLRTQTYGRIEQSLVAEARLIAEILQRHPSEVPPDKLDAEADRLAATLPARLTFIAADGRVLGDSELPESLLAGVENHATRPEVLAARRSGAGSARRYSHTVGTDMLYVAVRTRHPLIATVRLALPLTEVDQQVAAVRHVTLLALLVSLVGAGVLASVSSVLLGRRLTALAAAARRYARGDLSHPVHDYEDDQVGTVARALDGIVRELAGRVSDLAADRARVDAILSGMVEGVLVVDATGRVQLINRAARTLLGLDDAAVGAHYLECVRQPGIVTLLAHALGGGRPEHIEMSPSRGPERRLVARAAPVATGASGGAVLVLHDITDLRKADQVRRDFVANVSHELRTPLTVIRGYVEALAEESPGTGERAHFLDVIARHATRMERLVGDLLRLASLDAGQETVERGEIELETVVRSVVADLAPVIDARHQRVEVHVASEVAVIQSDAAKLQAALRNLVENAVHYSPEGRLIRIEAASQENRLALTVADEGPGIPEEDLERIFERFYRVDKARSRESGGTGLGLSIVKHLVELLGGRVRAANRPEGGALFTLTFPLDARGTQPGATTTRSSGSS